MKTFQLNPANHGVPPLVANLNLFLDDRGLVRSRGRIGKYSLYPQDILYPVLYPQYSYITDLIIMGCHHKCKHLGITASLSKLCLSGFWINKARKAIKLVISSCSLCKRYNAIHLELVNDMSTHPVVRVMVRFLIYIGYLPIYTLIMHDPSWLDAIWSSKSM